MFTKQEIANMIKIRIGMDILISYAIMRATGAEDLTTANNITVKLINTQHNQCELVNSFEVAGGNVLKIYIKGNDQFRTGLYRIIVAYTKHNPDRDPRDEPFILDSLAFELVPYSDMVGGDVYDADIVVKQISLSATIDRNKDGISATSDNSCIPSLQWRVVNGVLYVKPSGSADNPILDSCYVGLLRWKRSKNRFNTSLAGNKILRPSTSGYKMIQDVYAGASVTWSDVRINPISFDRATAALNGGWMAVMDIYLIRERFIERFNSIYYFWGYGYRPHRAVSCKPLSQRVAADGKKIIRATIYMGVVLFQKDGNQRIEGHREYFKLSIANHGHAAAIPTITK